MFFFALESATQKPKLKAIAFYHHLLIYGRFEKRLSFFFIFPFWSLENCFLTDKLLFTLIKTKHSYGMNYCDIVHCAQRYKSDNNNNTNNTDGDWKSKQLKLFGLILLCCLGVSTNIECDMKIRCIHLSQIFKRKKIVL